MAWRATTCFHFPRENAADFNATERWTTLKINKYIEKPSEFHQTLACINTFSDGLWPALIASTFLRPSMNNLWRAKTTSVWKVLKLKLFWAGYQKNDKNSSPWPNVSTTFWPFFWLSYVKLATVIALLMLTFPSLVLVASLRDAIPDLDTSTAWYCHLWRGGSARSLQVASHSSTPLVQCCLASVLKLKSLYPT